MQDNRSDRRPAQGGATWASDRGYRGQDPEPRWQGTPQGAQGSYRPSSALFQEPQERLNPFERSGYGYMDEPSAAQDGVHAAPAGERLRSRSADPGQSSYGGFKNEDSRHQRQQLGDYRPQRTLPKGYTRSDERIREDICEQLAYSGLDVSDVEVKVDNATITLEGTVSSRSIKHAIEDRVDNCLGVKDIHNRIRVQREHDAAGR